MKILKLTMAAAVVSLLAGSQALAQSTAAYGLQLPAQQTAYAYDGYYNQDPPATSPSDVPAAAAPAATEGNGACCEKSDPCANQDCCEAAEDDAPWSVMDWFGEGSFLKRSSINVGGWTEMGYQNHPDGAFTGNGPFLTEFTGAPANGEWLRPNLNQQWLWVERLADGSTDQTFGFRCDLLYGVDGNDAQSFGNHAGRWDFLNGWDNGVYNWAMPQLYGQVAVSDKLSVKLGHFFTPTGYEVIPPLGNFFFSRQITWYNGEAFTHTGALANYKATDKFSLMGGWTLGWDTGFDQFRGGNMGLTGFAWNMSDKTVLSYWAGFGNFGWRGEGFTNGFILSQKWTKKITSVHQFDVLTTNNPTDFAVDGVANNDVALVNYLFYEFAPKLVGGVRSEWWKADGISYYTFTYGLNIKLTKNLIVRPEGRYLWAPGVANPNAPSTIAQNVFDVYGNNAVFGMDAVWSY